jgi:C-terminal processing protease CtpA/Prc
MRSLTFLVLTATAATAATAASAAAQQPDRRAETRAASEARAAQARDSVRIRVRGADLESEIERVTAQLLMLTQIQNQARQGLEALNARRGEPTAREQWQETERVLRTQFSQSSRQTQFLRGQLAALCDRNAKPQGYMGITFSATMQAEAGASGVEVFRFTENPTVETVEPGSPAERAGVTKGDEIIRIGGQNVIGSDIVFTRLLRPGSKLPVRIRRDGDSRDVLLVIGERPAALDNGCPFLDARIMAAFGDPLMVAPRPSSGTVRAAPLPPRGAVAVGSTRRSAPTPDAPPTPVAVETVVLPPPPMVPSVPLVAPNAPERRGGERSVYIVQGGGILPSQMVIAGATIVRPNADLRETFGVNSGVLVLDVARGSPAYASGLKGGDIIISAGRLTVTSPLAIRRAMESADANEIALRIVRKKKTQSLTLRW